MWHGVELDPKADPYEVLALGKASRSVAGQCEERGRHARGQIGKGAEDRTMIPIAMRAKPSTNYSRRGSFFLLHRLLTAPAGS
jgi:hypothetical protein